jgi:FMN phosphatase YigB (HAD superfamily)
MQTPQQPRKNRSVLIPIAAILGFLCAIALQTSVTSWVTACKRPWVFFDLGNTLVSADPGESMHYAPGARDYVKQLRLRGFRVGMVSNVPESWGSSHKEKLSRLKRTVREEWSRDPAAKPMDWSDFSDALIFLPPGTEHRKPAPYLFRAALSQVVLEEGETRCQVIFQGDDPSEVETARKEGMLGFVISKDSPFPAIDELERLTR